MPLECVDLKNQSAPHNECVSHLPEKSAFLLWIENDTLHNQTRKQIGKAVGF
jgi:hypothetical protein